MTDARTPDPLRGVDEHRAVHMPADPSREDVAVLRGLRPSWDEWIADHADAWPTDDDAPDAFRMIS